MPDDLVRAVSLIGPAGFVRERVAAFAEAGVTHLYATPMAPTHERRLADVALVADVAC